MASLKLALHFQPYWWQMETGNKKTKTECLKNILRDNRIHQTHKSRILSERVAITWHKVALGDSQGGELRALSRRTSSLGLVIPPKHRALRHRSEHWALSIQNLLYMLGAKYSHIQLSLNLLKQLINIFDALNSNPTEFQQVKVWLILYNSKY